MHLRRLNVRTDYYDPEENKWTNKTNLKFAGFTASPTIQCSIRIFKGLFNNRQQVETFRSRDRFPETATAQPSFYAKKRERKCFIM